MSVKGKGKSLVGRPITRLNKESMPRFVELAAARINTLITGPHGIGKTTMFHELCATLGMKGAYINVPSADFFVDWLGIPAPSEPEPESIRTVRWLAGRGNDYLAERYVETTLNLHGDDAKQMVQFVKHQPELRTLDFLRPRRLDGVQFVFFDELNRESDPRFLDACMELVQFKTINGQRLTDLQLVWGAINPANSIYKVKELDAPLVDKFGAHIFLEGEPDFDWYVSKGYAQHTVSAVIQWYGSDLNAEQRQRISPRFLENVMRLVDNNIDPEFGLLQAAGVPGHLLSAKLRKVSTSHRFQGYDLQRIAREQVGLVVAAKSDFDFCAFYTDMLLRNDVHPVDIFRTIPVFIQMPFEWQSKCMSDPQWRGRIDGALKNLASLPAEVHSIEGMQSFSEMVRQFVKP